jgi:PBP1b-binding outer membrane lipoprotein LpoB
MKKLLVLALLALLMSSCLNQKTGAQPWHPGTPKQQK